MSNIRNMKMSSVDDLFKTDESRADDQREKIMDIPLSELHPFKDHPFRVNDNEELRELAKSIKERGVISPAIVRPRPEGGYELIAGHRRKAASQIAGLETMPVIVRELDNDAATIVMVDSNQQRENLLPSEKAFSYKMKLDAMKRQGQRTDLTSAQVGPKSRSNDVLAEQSEDSRNQIKRYIRLTYLVPEILKKVDEKNIAFNPAVELSYLPKEAQKALLEAMAVQQCTPSLSQAQRLKALHQQGKLELDMIVKILGETKANQRENFTQISCRVVFRQLRVIGIINGTSINNKWLCVMFYFLVTEQTYVCEFSAKRLCLVKRRCRHGNGYLSTAWRLSFAGIQHRRGSAVLRQIWGAPENLSEGTRSWGILQPAAFWPVERPSCRNRRDRQNHAG